MISSNQWNNVLKMMKHRGYEISLDTPIVSYFSITNCKTVIYCHDQIKLSTQQSKQLISRLTEDKITHIIIITSHPVSRIVQKQFSNFETELFQLFEFNFCFIEHDLCPRHKILSKEETDKFLQQHKIEKDNLPRLLAHNPFTRFYGLKTGIAVIFLREYPNNEPCYFVRICADS